MCARAAAVLCRRCAPCLNRRAELRPEWDAESAEFGNNERITSSGSPGTGRELNFVILNDVCMPQIGSIGLSAKPFYVAFIGQISGQNHLDRNRTIQAYLASFVDHTHTTSSNFFQQFVSAETTQHGIRGELLNPN